MPTQREIAKEHGMSFLAVVRLYAEAGHSIHDTACILGRDPGSFRRLCQRQGWEGLFKRGQDSLASKQARADRRGVCTDGLRAACKAASDANPTYHSIEWGGVTDTLTGHCSRMGLAVSTVRKRLVRRPGDYAYAFSQRSHVKPPTSTHGHTWRTDSYKNQS
jgi:hypothetical protein